MAYNPQIHHRHSIRLKGYDYTREGAYFITVCVQDHVRLFGKIVNGEMRLNESGKIVAETWDWLSTQYDYVKLDAMVVMPDHIHGIIIITVYPYNSCRVDARIDTTILPRIDPTILPRIDPTTIKRKSIGHLIGAFKTVSTKQINIYRNTPGMRIWQRNYYEHIIRNNLELNRIRNYISNNIILFENNMNQKNGKTQQ